MSTQFTVTYKTEDGNVRGVNVHFDGHPNSALVMLRKRLNAEGFDAIKRWVDEGAAVGYYETVLDTRPVRENLQRNAQIYDGDYGYEVTRDAVWPKCSKVFTGRELDIIAHELGSLNYCDEKFPENNRSYAGVEDDRERLKVAFDKIEDDRFNDALDIIRKRGGRVVMPAV